MYLACLSCLLSKCSLLMLFTDQNHSLFLRYLAVLVRSSSRPSLSKSPVVASSPSALQRHSRHADPALRSPPGSVSMSQLGEDCCNRLLQELSAIPESQSIKSQHASASKPAGPRTISTSATTSSACGASTAMPPVFLSQVIQAAVEDILSSS